jgi:hypothetical protein
MFPVWVWLRLCAFLGQELPDERAGFGHGVEVSFYGRDDRAREWL